jgi:hypothetical protein
MNFTCWIMATELCCACAPPLERTEPGPPAHADDAQHGRSLIPPCPQEVIHGGMVRDYSKMISRGPFGTSWMIFHERPMP